MENAKLGGDLQNEVGREASVEPTGVRRVNAGDLGQLLTDELAAEIDEIFEEVIEAARKAETAADVNALKPKIDTASERVNLLVAKLPDGLSAGVLAVAIGAKVDQIVSIRTEKAKNDA